MNNYAVITLLFKNYVNNHLVKMSHHINYVIVTAIYSLLLFQKVCTMHLQCYF